MYSQAIHVLSTHGCLADISHITCNGTAHFTGKHTQLSSGSCAILRFFNFTFRLIPPPGLPCSLSLPASPKVHILRRDYTVICSHLLHILFPS